MREDHQNLSEQRGDRMQPGLAISGKKPDPSSVNPYQSPPCPEQESVAQPSSLEDTDPGVAFWGTAGLLIASTIIVTATSLSLGLPLMFATVLGTMRATVLLVQREQAHEVLASIVFLFTSTMVTLLLMGCSAILFIALCASGIVVLDDGYGSSGGPSWAIVCGGGSVIVFIFLFVWSTKWSA